MADISNYFKTRRVAVIIAMIILVLGSIVYFSTSVAERNNEMMYKEIYGENATIRNDVIVVENDSIQSTNTALV